MDFNPKPVNQPTPPPSFQPTAAEPSFYRANKYYIWVSVFAILIIAILAYFAFKPAAPTAVKEANVEIELQAPETLPSGNEAVYRVAVRNKDSAKLTDLELEITPRALLTRKAVLRPKIFPGVFLACLTFCRGKTSV